MSIYRQQQNKLGRTQYLITKTVGETEDGAPKVRTVFIAKKNIPANIFRELEAGKEAVDDEGMQLEGNVKECIFCGQVCKWSRIVNMQTIYLCEEHYYDKTIGQIAQRMREAEEVRA